MATAAELILSARYDVRDSDKTQYSDAMMLDFLNRGVRGLVVVLAMAKSDWVNTTEDLILPISTNETDLPEYFISDKSAVIDTTYLIKKPVSTIRDMRLSGGTGKPSSFAISKTNLIVETTVATAQTITLEFNQGVAALLLAADMPFNDEFNDVLRQFIVLLCKTRNEYTLVGDAAIQDFFYQALFSKLVARNYIPNIAKTKF